MTITIYTILRDEHRSLSESLRALPSTVGAARRSTLDKLTRELVAHLEAEDQVFYNGIQSDEATLVSREEHAILMRCLEDLNTIRLEDERFVAKVRVLEKLWSAHVEEEEQEVWPAARARFDDLVAESLGGQYLAARDQSLDRSALVHFGQHRLRQAFDDVRHLISPQPQA